MCCFIVLTSEPRAPRQADSVFTQTPLLCGRYSCCYLSATLARHFDLIVFCCFYLPWGLAQNKRKMDFFTLYVQISTCISLTLFLIHFLWYFPRDLVQFEFEFGYTLYNVFLRLGHYRNWGYVLTYWPHHFGCNGILRSHGQFYKLHVNSIRKNLRRDCFASALFHKQDDSVQ